ncbi:MAG TPA: SAM-dependent methyltransferase [Candidatus Omnitrophica bacterium]|nr:MAG: hypothetical protein A2105_05865 [Omnitrophica WOR_2 bacterium GWF2_63_9]OGX49160.1 MAG: hypothetical protein A3G88_04545 [Omnitrophica WOR_2 bacterium RIFCSPLOWO2_12_FULL_63_16]HAM41384.1 SAM-dependent methyltransferase [Candidatus Omnitrophota bacterium]HBH96788.1 SAM-dependent methyltransferase [Candidatus Omnitrophota bacterium]HBQ38272.1 SAM-dependent methyltransferase [Candidatus Omnitrophota bacterium]
MSRQLEPEVMDSPESVQAYDELDRLFGEILFQGFAESALRLSGPSGRVLDVGAGPGWIPIRLAILSPDYRIDAIDLSAPMLELAREHAKAFGVARRIRFSLGDAKRLPFEDQRFDLVLCHNLLHQLPDPLVALREINRVAKPDGALLIRDVRRLARPWMDLALPFYCLRYRPRLKQLTRDSFRAGLTRGEFTRLVASAGIERAKVRSFFLTHLGLERPARAQMAAAAEPILLGSLPTRLMKSLYLSNLADHFDA